MKKTIILLLTIAGFLSISLPTPASAVDVLNPACEGFAGGADNTPTVCNENNTQQTTSNNSIYGPNGIIGKIARVMVVFVGVASVIMIIIGGLRYVLANGDPNSINGAKNNILYAIIGLIIAVAAQSIVIFVLNKL